MFIKRSINQYYNTEEADLFGSVPDHLWLIEIISPHAPCSVQVLCTSYKQSIHTQTKQQHKTVFLFLLQFDFPSFITGFQLHSLQEYINLYLELCSEQLEIKVVLSNISL